MGVTTSPVAFGRVAEIPKQLKLSPPGTRTNYDLTPDGRFVGFVTAGQKKFIRGSTSQIQVVLNWFEELTSLMAATH